MFFAGLRLRARNQKGEGNDEKAKVELWAGNVHLTVGGGNLGRSAGAAGGHEAADVVAAEFFGPVADFDEAPTGHDDLDDVVAPGDARVLDLIEVVLGGADDAEFLGEPDGVGGPGALAWFAGLDLDEAEDLTVTGNEVNLAGGRVVVAGEDFQAEGFEEPGGAVLAAAAESLVGGAGAAEFEAFGHVLRPCGGGVAFCGWRAKVTASRISAVAKAMADKKVVQAGGPSNCPRRKSAAGGRDLMDFEEFCEHVKQHGEYETANPRRPAMFVNLRFYSRFIYVVLRNSLRCRSAGYSLRDIQRGSYWMLHNNCERLGGRVHISGLHHLRSVDRTPVIVGNHMSTLETTVLHGITAPFVKLTYIMKESLLSYPFFGRIVQLLEPVTVRRQRARADLKAVLELGSQKLADGWAVVIFPQSTRSVEFDPRKFNSSGVRLAREANAPVVPLALKTDMWGNGRLRKEFGPTDPRQPIHFEFGEPFTVTDLKADNQRITDFISSRLAAWGHRGGKALSPPSVPGTELNNHSKGVR